VAPIFWSKLDASSCKSDRRDKPSSYSSRPSHNTSSGKSVVVVVVGVVVVVSVPGSSASPGKMGSPFCSTLRLFLLDSCCVPSFSKLLSPPPSS